MQGSVSLYACPEPTVGAEAKSHNEYIVQINRPFDNRTGTLIESECRTVGSAPARQRNNASNISKEKRSNELTT
jgi:hypothetical protein